MYKSMNRISDVDFSGAKDRRVRNSQHQESDKHAYNSI